MQAEFTNEKIRIAAVKPGERIDERRSRPTKIKGTDGNWYACYHETAKDLREGWLIEASGTIVKKEGSQYTDYTIKEFKILENVAPKSTGRVSGRENDQSPEYWERKQYIECRRMIVNNLIATGNYHSDLLQMNKDRFAADVEWLVELVYKGSMPDLSEGQNGHENGKDEEKPGSIAPQEKAKRVNDEFMAMTTDLGWDDIERAKFIKEHFNTTWYRLKLEQKAEAVSILAKEVGA